MNRTSLRPIAVAAALVALGGALTAQINVSSDITTSTTWTTGNTYNLTTQIYVTSGATLTIQPGVIVASTTGTGGSLAVTRGSMIFVNGTELQPVIMTSTADTATWIGGDPKTGTYRLGMNEWGNLTICGQAYISENAAGLGNTSTFGASNYGIMEGLTEAFPGDTRVRYGGGNDDDDSGSVQYLSLRYGGKVIGLNNELNGLSLGGIGRNTDIHHVEIMNNVDDGIEIWGGTVNLKYFSIWNVGDDSLDIDQGWRGKAQFGLIVQGYSGAGAQGGGVGDNCMEMDGAEDSNYEPVTTAKVYNMTVIGQPVSGDHGTAWRDNARVQIRNSIFMDLGERLVNLDNVDGDGANGYGFSGTLSWANTWTTAASTSANYPAQTDGNLIELKDSVFYNNLFGTAYTEATARGVLAPANNNVQAVSLPIQAISRGPNAVVGAFIMQPVTQLDPRPANDALTSAAWAPNDGFFSSAHYRGAFGPGSNWLLGWSAADAYGLLVRTGVWCDVGSSLTGTNGYPVLSATGDLAPLSSLTFDFSNLTVGSGGLLRFGTGRLDLPIFGGNLVPNLSIPDEFLILAFSSTASLGLTVPTGLPTGVPIYCQAGFLDGAAPQGISLTNALVKVLP